MSEYSKTVWARGDLITSNKLNNIENGVESAHTEVEQVRALVSSNADKIEENATRAQEAADAVVARTEAIESEMAERANAAAAHIEAYQDTVSKVAANVSGIAEAKAAANLAKQKADANETSIGGIQNQLTDITKENGVIDQKIAAGIAPMISDTEYNTDQQARANAYDALYARKTEISEAISNATEAKETATENANAVATLRAEFDTAKAELNEAKELISGNAERIQANADAAEAATAQINANVQRIDQLVSDAETHMTQYSDAVAKLNQNVNQIAAATNTANEAKSESVEAKTAATEANTKADTAANNAAAARTDADAAAASATAAQASATASATSADEANSKAILAESQATAANTRAGEAESAARDAQASATAAAGSAATASEEATTAKNQAEAANTTAGEAKTKAESALEALTDAQLIATLRRLIPAGLIKFVDPNNSGKTLDATQIKHVVETIKNGKTLQATIWNEASGGGMQFWNPIANIISFLGINNGDGDNDIWAQFYAKNKTTNVGTRMNFTNHGVYMTVDKANGSYTEDDLLVTKKDLANILAVAVAGDNAEPLSSNVALRARMKALEDQFNAFSKGDSIAIDLASLSSETGIASADNATVATEDGKKTITATEYDLVFNGGAVVEDVNNITAKSIDIKAMTAQNARLNLAATGSVTISNLKTSGTLSKDISNAAISINTSDHVRITDSDISENSYNAIEVALGNNNAPKSVIIDGVEFKGELANNTISIFDTADYCQVTISNCNFVKCSNPLRISNRSNVHVDIKFLNCTFGITESNNPAYGGLCICQSYTDADAAAAIAANRFAPEKVSISFQNCQYKGINMSAFKSKAASDLCGSGTADQLVYVYTDATKAVEAYNSARYPKLTIDGQVIE